MKTHKCLIMAMLSFSVLACRSEMVPEDGKNISENTCDSSYDIKITDLAKALSKLLVDIPESRRVVKEGIMQRFDNDYEILLSSISKEKLPPSEIVMRTKGLVGETTFGALLNAYLTSDTKSGGMSIIEQLQEEYPDLQISVPVHADDWDPDSYIPVIAYIPENLVDSTATVIPGFTQTGNYVELDAQSIPDDPVIVISRNERGGILDPILLVPSAPQNLTAVTTANSILLSWSRSINADRYIVYRKAPGQTDFGVLGISSGVNNTSYEDTLVQAGVYYQYYVCAQTVQLSLNPNDPSAFMESVPSNLITVQAPAYPSTVSDFEVSLATSSLALLGWNNNGVTGSDVKIDYMIPGINNMYTTYTTLPGTENSTTFQLPYVGRRHVFKIYRVNEMGPSDAKYGFCYRPYRDIMSSSTVYIKKLSYTDGSIEHWYRGAPEFYLKVYYCKENSQNLVSTVRLEFSERKLSQTFNGKIAFVWNATDYKKDWYSSLYLYLYETDGGTNNQSVTINPSIALSVANAINLEFSAVSLTFNIGNTDSNMGGNDIYYYQNPDVILHYDYGGELTISANP